MRPAVSMATVLERLSKLYSPPRSFLKWKTPLELLIATVLSARCTDRQVNRVTPEIFQKYRAPQDYLAVPPSTLESAIRSCGTYRIKAGYIRGICKMILEEFDGEVPQTMEELTQLPGVGRKTAAIILYAAFGKNEGIAVDTHVQRVSRRLGLTKHADPKRIELDLLEQTPREEWGEVNTLFISHGRAICTARNRKCHACVFQKECPSSLVQGRGDLAKRK